MLTANINERRFYLSLLVLMCCRNAVEQHFSTSEGQSVSILHQYFTAKRTREVDALRATDQRVDDANLQFEITAKRR